MKIDAADIRPTLTWGTHPGTAIAIDAPIPAATDDSARKGLAYMGFAPAETVAGREVDVVFVGSCTNGRLSDMRDVAMVLQGRHIHPRVRMLVVPGSEPVKRAAEAEGIDRIVRRRCRMARAWLFDVHRHEWRHRGRWSNGSQHQQSQL